MFKKIVQSISKSLHKPEAKDTKPSAATKNIEPKKAETPLKKIIDAPPPAIKVEAPKTPEELCGIEPKMGKDQIKERLNCSTAAITAPPLAWTTARAERPMQCSMPSSPCARSISVRFEKGAMASCRRCQLTQTPA